MDFDQWQERAAIMEFDAGMTRFEAETKAAQEQGCKRWEFTKNECARNSTGGGNIRQAGKRNTEDDLPAMQRGAAEQDGPMPVGDIQNGRDRLELLALRMDGGKVL